MTKPDASGSGNLPTAYEDRELAPWEEGFGMPDSYLHEPEGVDWERFAHILWRRKWWIVLAAILGLAAGYLANRHLVTHQYQTTATVWVETSDEQRGPIEATDFTYGQGWADIFRSNSVLRPIAERFGLYLNVNSVDGVQDEATLFRGLDVTDEVVSGRYTFSVDSTGRYRLAHQSRGVVDRGSLDGPIGESVGFEWSLSESEVPPGTRAVFNVQSPTAAARGLSSRVEVLFNPQAGNIITTHLTSTDPERAARIHNAVLDTAIAVAYRLKTQKLDRVVGVLQEQADSAAERLRQAELSLEEYRVQTITEPDEEQAQLTPQGITTQDPVFDQFFERRINAGRLESSIEQLRAELSEAREDSLDALGLTMIPAVDDFPALSNALDELTAARSEREALLDQYTPQHPQVEQINSEIQELRDEEIPTHLQQLVSRLENRLAGMREDIDQQAGELRRIPTRTIEEARRRREMQMAEQLHNDILGRLKEAQLAASTTQPDLQVVDRAHPPNQPTNSRRAIQVFLATTLGGLGLGIGGIFLHDQLDSSLQSPEEVEDGLRLPVLGVIPRIRSASDPDGDEALEVLESFRGLRNQLARRGNRDNRVILVTSPAPRDGKSLVSANLAISYATAGADTALVDVDVRRGNAETYFDLPGQPGVTDYLHGRVDLPGMLQPTEVDRLTLIPHGNLRRFDADLLEGQRMERLIREIRDSFDMVVLDGSPLVAGVDSMVLGEYADKALLVLRAGGTDQNLAQTRLEVAARFDLPLVGAVLNDVPDHAPYYRYYSSYSNYPYHPDSQEVVA